MEKSNIKNEARQLVDSLPNNSSWDDLMYKIYVRQSIDAGLKDSAEGKVASVHDVRKKYGLPK